MTTKDKTEFQVEELRAALTAYLEDYVRWSRALTSYQKEYTDALQDFENLQRPLIELIEETKHDVQRVKSLARETAEKLYELTQDRKPHKMITVVETTIYDVATPEAEQYVRLYFPGALKYDVSIAQSLIREWYERKTWQKTIPAPPVEPTKGIRANVAAVKDKNDE